MARVWLGVLLYAAVCPIAYSAASDFGTTGLIKMPNARMEKDGALRATVSLDKVANIYNVSFQALPRVQATGRYTIFNPREIRGSSNRLRDRSYEIKALAIEESGLMPAVAVGARDILGTGAWEAEYVVASKGWGRFDVSVGLGWGRLGSRSGFSNPLGLISDRFDNRPSVRESGGEFGGETREAVFSGERQLFSVVWRTVLRGPPSR